MRRILTTASLLGILSLASVPAKADVAWLGVGSRFHVGDVHFSLVFGHPGHAYPRGYYYRTAQPFHVHGVQCGSSCFRSGGVYYHGESCPLVRAQFVRLGYDPYDYYDRYAPRGYYAGRSWRSYGYSSRFDSRYDSYHRYDHRYDRPTRSYGNGWEHDSRFDRRNDGRRHEDRRFDDRRRDDRRHEVRRNDDRRQDDRRQDHRRFEGRRDGRGRDSHQYGNGRSRQRGGTHSPRK